MILGLIVKIRAWQFSTFAWQPATLSSTLNGFTSEFGMGSGGSHSLWSPSKLVSKFHKKFDMKIGKFLKALFKFFNTNQTDWVLYGQASRAISTR